MAKKVETKEVTTAAETPVTAAPSLILSPRITEKASLQSTANAYTFVVASGATKLEIAKEIKKQFNVSPVKVNITNIKGTNVFVRGKWGKTLGYKKAVVFLKKGDAIAFA